MFTTNLGQCEHALYLGCRECSNCQIKAEERAFLRNLKKEREMQETAEYERLLRELERL